MCLFYHYGRRIVYNKNYVVSCISDIFCGEFVFSSDGVDFAGCSCIMKVYVNV